MFYTACVWFCSSSFSSHSGLKAPRGQRFLSALPMGGLVRESLPCEGRPEKKASTAVTNTVRPNTAARFSKPSTACTHLRQRILFLLTIPPPAHQDILCTPIRTVPNIPTWKIFLSYLPQSVKHDDIGTIIILILQMRKLRFKEVMELVQHHTASKCWSKIGSQIYLDTRARVLQYYTIPTT